MPRSENPEALLKVTTKGATYLVDHDNYRWMRTQATTPSSDDNKWVAGGFTLGEVGQGCFAHFADHPEGPAGRWTSRVVAVSSIAKAADV